MLSAIACDELYFLLTHMIELNGIQKCQLKSIDD